MKKPKVIQLYVANDIFSNIINSRPASKITEFLISEIPICLKPRQNIFSETDFILFSEKYFCHFYVWSVKLISEKRSWADEEAGNLKIRFETMSSQTNIMNFKMNFKITQLLWKNDKVCNIAETAQINICLTKFYSVLNSYKAISSEIVFEKIWSRKKCFLHNWTPLPPFSRVSVLELRAVRAS